MGNYAGGLTLFAGTPPPAVGIPQYSVTQQLSTLKTFPNPASSMMTVEATSPIREITVYDLSGRVVVETRCSTSLQPQCTLNVSSLPGGLYILRAITENGVATGRFVKTGR